MTTEEDEKTLEPDSIIDNKYSVIRQIGHGNFAFTYLVLDNNDKKKYSAKILKEKTSQIDIKSFKNEIMLLKELTNSSKNNVYVSKYHDSGYGPIKKNDILIYNKDYFVGDFYLNGSLGMYLNQTGKGFSEDIARIIFYKILLGVKECHDANICHLDISLNNILLDSEFNPIIIDFGLSQKMIYDEDIKNYKDINYQENGEFVIKGTRPFICPEIEYCKKFKGKNADIFSLGVVLFYLVTKSKRFNMARKNDTFYKYISKMKENDKKKIEIDNAFWKETGEENDKNNKKRISELSDEVKNLYLKMVAFSLRIRYNSIDDIIEKDPWISKIKDYKKEDYPNYKKTMEELKDLAKADNPSFESLLNAYEEENDNRGLKTCNQEGDFINYFDQGLKPNYIYEKGFNAKNYIQIKGELIAYNFMNSLANNIRKKFNIENEICKIKEDPEKLKFQAIFYIPEEENEINENDDIENDNEENEEEEEKEFTDTQLIDCILKIELYQSINGGYEVHFNKGEGDIMKYYEYYGEIKSIIKKIIKCP